MVWEFGETSVFSHHAFLLRIGRNSIAPILFAQSVMLLLLSVQIRRTTLCFLAAGAGSMS